MDYNEINNLACSTSNIPLRTDFRSRSRMRATQRGTYPFDNHDQRIYEIGVQCLSIETEEDTYEKYWEWYLDNRIIRYSKELPNQQMEFSFRLPYYISKDLIGSKITYKCSLQESKQLYFLYATENIFHAEGSETLLLEEFLREYYEKMILSENSVKSARISFS